MLEVKDIHSYYGKSHILQGVSMTLNEGELVCLLGRNGVGKSTTLKSIMGLVRPSEGSIRFGGQELIGKQPYEIARLGVGYVPEDRRIFRSLSVHENLLMGVKGSKGAAGNGGWTVERVY
jgi:branched-chain amino acid transport system ATP-binding protein